jgi:hypothetical protein
MSSYGDSLIASNSFEFLNVAVKDMIAALKSVKPVMTESQLATEAQYAMRRAGAYSG